MTLARPVFIWLLALPLRAWAHHGEDRDGFPWSLLIGLSLPLAVLLLWIWGAIVGRRRSLRNRQPEE